MTEAAANPEASSGDSIPDAQKALCKQVLESMQNGVQTIWDNAQAVNPESPVLVWLTKHKDALSRLLPLADSMPAEKTRLSLLSMIKLLDHDIQNSRNIEDVIPGISDLDEDEAPSFLIDAAISIGPQISFGPKQMTAAITIPKDIVRFVHPEAVRVFLQNHGVQFGILEESIEKIYAERYFDRLVRIAKGKQPTRGTDAQIEECLNQLRMSGPKFRQVGTRVDYKDVISFEPVQNGQLILKRIPNTDGEPGSNVLGEEIPSEPGVDLELPKIENTHIDGSGLELYSDVDGCAFIEDGQIKIVPSFNLKGNVDYESGNINSPVAVVIEGDVLTDFKVESKMEIVVKGVVEGAFLKADGNIVCSGGVKGKQKAMLQSKRHIQATELNQATAIAGGTIVVESAIIQSQCSAKRIECVEKNGEILGGKLAAWVDVCAKKIGTERGTKTEIVLGGEQPVLEDKLRKIEEAIEEKEQYRHKYATMQTKLQKAFEEAPSPELSKKTENVNASLAKLDEMVAALEEKKLKAQQELEYSSQCSRMVRATENMYPGTIIKIGDSVYPVKELLGPSCIVLIDDEIKAIPYQDREFDDDVAEDEE